MHNQTCLIKIWKEPFGRACLKPLKAKLKDRFGEIQSSALSLTLCKFCPIRAFMLLSLLVDMEAAVTVAGSRTNGFSHDTKSNKYVQFKTCYF